MEWHERCNTAPCQRSGARRFSQLLKESDHDEGVQFGIVNVTEHLHGVEIGLVNVARNGLLPVFVIFNAAL